MTGPTPDSTLESEVDPLGPTDATIISVLNVRFAYRRQSVVDGIFETGGCRTQGIGRPKIPIWQTM